MLDAMEEVEMHTPAGILYVLPAGPARTSGVALTFDDGPGPFTAAVLDVLATEGVRATFFVTGAHVLAHADLAERIAREGHLLANHTFSHPQDVPGASPRGHFDELPAREQADQMDRTTAAITGLGAPVPRFFRGPGGRHHGAVTAALAAERGMRIVDWSVDTGDWCQPAHPSGPARDAIIARATAEGVRGRAVGGAATAGPIVLLHDGKASAEPESLVSAFRGSTVAALPAVVRHHRACGCTFRDPAGALLPVPAGGVV